MPATTPTSLHRPPVLGGEAQASSPRPTAPAPPAAPAVSWASQQQALPTAAVKSGSGCVSQFRPRTTPPRDGPAARAPPLPGARGTASSAWLGAGAETPDFPGNPVPLTRFSLRKATRDAERGREMTRGPVQPHGTAEGHLSGETAGLRQEHRRASPARAALQGGRWLEGGLRAGRTPGPVSPPHSRRPLGAELHFPPRSSLAAGAPDFLRSSSLQARGVTALARGDFAWTVFLQVDWKKRNGRKVAGLQRRLETLPDGTPASPRRPGSTRVRGSRQAHGRGQGPGNTESLSHSATVPTEAWGFRTESHSCFFLLTLTFLRVPRR